jgi:hypothetical protein
MQGENPLESPYLLDHGVFIFGTQASHTKKQRRDVSMKYAFIDA